MRSVCLIVGLLAIACDSSTPGSTNGAAGADAGGSKNEGGGTSGGASTAGTSTAGTNTASGGVAGSEIPTDGGMPAGLLVAKPLGSTDAAQGYQEYLPTGYGNGAKRPLIVAVHGLGENGNGTSDLDKITGIGIGKVISSGQWPASRPFVVLAPQHPPTPVASGFDCTTPAELHDFIDYALANYEVDPARVYLAAYSCGAIGSWSYLGKYVDQQVAAAVLVAGDGQAAWTAQGCKLANVGIWAFHGLLDATVPPAGSTEPMAKLMECPQPRKDQRITTYPNAGHETWIQTYELSDSPNDIYGWMLGISR
jgi:predicted peptidase